MEQVSLPSPEPAPTADSGVVSKVAPGNSEPAAGKVTGKAGGKGPLGHEAQGGGPQGDTKGSKDGPNGGPRDEKAGGSGKGAKDEKGSGKGARDEKGSGNRAKDEKGSGNGAKDEKGSGNGGAQAPARGRGSKP